MSEWRDDLLYMLRMYALRIAAIVLAFAILLFVFCVLPLVGISKDFLLDCQVFILILVLGISYMAALGLNARFCWFTPDKQARRIRWIGLVAWIGLMVLGVWMAVGNRAERAAEIERDQEQQKVREENSNLFKNPQVQNGANILRNRQKQGSANFSVVR